jgi:trigger factor
MKWEVKDEKDCRKVIDVVVEKERVETVQKKIFEAYKNNARLDGYRKGKAPEDLVKTKFKKDMDEEVVKELVPDTYSEVIKALDLHIVTYPMLKDVKFEGDGIKYQIIVEVNPTFELKEYKKIKIDDKKLKAVTDADVDREIDRLRQYRGKLKDSADMTVKEGHYVTISMAGFVDGKAEASMTSDSQFLKIGAGTMVKDLEDGIKGMKSGDEKDVNVKFPSDYFDKNFAGKSAVIKVKLKSIKDLEMPEMTDAFAKEVSGKETVAELKALIKDNLTKQAEEEIKNAKVDQIITKLLDMHKFELPKGLVEEEINNIISRYTNNLTQQGLSLKALGMTMEDLRAKSRAQAENNIRTIYILRKIAESEKIDVSDADVEVEIKRIAVETKDNADNMIKQAKARGSWDSLKAKLLEDKVIDSLITTVK